MAFQMSQDTSSTTRYADVAGKLIDAISGGRHAVGSLLPTELELAESFGVSRQTVRIALQALQDRGYISRKKGVGSRVESLHPESGYTQTLAALDDLVKVAATEVRRIRSVQPVRLGRAAARELQAPYDSQWLCFSALRVDTQRGERPISWARIYIDPRFARIAASVQAHPEILVSAFLERECGQSIDEVRQTIQATMLDAELAAQLEAPAGSPALRVLRHYRTTQQLLIEMTETIYPAQRMNLTSTLRRNRATAQLVSARPAAAAPSYP